MAQIDDSPAGPAQSSAWVTAFPKATIEAWRKSVDKVLAGADFEKKLVTATLEGIAVQPLYTAADWPHAQDLAGFAGAAPYRRGTLPIGRNGERWDLRARFDHPDPAVLAREIQAECKRGLKSVWLCLDRQARNGRAQAAPDQDRGVGCVSAAQLATLLEHVPLDRMPVSIDAGGNALALAACLARVASQRGVALEQLAGSLDADPLGALALDGTLPCSIDSAAQQMGALGVWASERAPKLRSVVVSVVPYHDAGAHAAQELGFALATGVAYLRFLTAAGLTIGEASKQIVFRIPLGSDIFMEVAKLRALRQCWAQVVGASGGTAEDQRSVIHATTSSRTKSQRDPWVNMLRETTEAFAASVGGADAITTSGFDRALGFSDDFARRIAGNAQVILDEEAHVAEVADPAGGSYYVEKLTDALAERGWQLLQTIEAEGGMAQALTQGRVTVWIGETAQARASAIAKRKQAILGVSEFAHVAEDEVVRAAPDWKAIEQARGAALAATSRDEAVVEPLVQARASLSASPSTRAASLACVEAAIAGAAEGASLGQLSCALAGGGEPPRIEPLALRRDAAPFEALRDAADQHAKRTGQRPQAFLCNLGPIPQHKARAQFASGFLAAGGFNVLDNDGFETPEAASAAFAASGAPIAVLCGSEDAYATWVAQLAPRIGKQAKRVVLAGRPAPEVEAQYRAAGVTDFIFMGADALATLKQLLAAVGALS